MSNEIYRRVYVRTWCTADFRALSGPRPNARYLLIYLLTGPDTTPLPGLFAATQEGLAAKLGWAARDFRKVFAELSGSDVDVRRKRFAEADWEAGVVWIKDALAGNEPANPNILKGWKKHADMVPECDLKTKALTALELWAKNRGPAFEEAYEEAFACTFRGTAGNHSSNQEQSQEQKQKQKQKQESQDPRANQQESSVENEGPVRADATAEPVEGDVGYSQEASEAKEGTECTVTSLKSQVALLSAEYGHHVVPSAASSQWAVGACKVNELVKVGDLIDRALERVARSSLERLSNGKSSSFGFALQDCVLGNVTGSSHKLQGNSLDATELAAHGDFADVVPVAEQLKKIGAAS